MEDFKILDTNERKGTISYKAWSHLAKDKQNLKKLQEKFIFKSKGFFFLPLFKTIACNTERICQVTKSTQNQQVCSQSQVNTVISTAIHKSDKTKLDKEFLILTHLMLSNVMDMLDRIKKESKEIRYELKGLKIQDEEMNTKLEEISNINYLKTENISVFEYLKKKQFDVMSNADYCSLMCNSIPIVPRFTDPTNSNQDLSKNCMSDRLQFEYDSEITNLDPYLAVDVRVNEGKTNLTTSIHKKVTSKLLQSNSFKRGIQDQFVNSSSSLEMDIDDEPKMNIKTLTNDNDIQHTSVPNSTLGTTTFNDRRYLYIREINTINSENPSSDHNLNLLFEKLNNNCMCKKVDDIQEPSMIFNTKNITGSIDATKSNIEILECKNKVNQCSANESSLLKQVGLVDTFSNNLLEVSNIDSGSKDITFVSRSNIEAGFGNGKNSKSQLIISEDNNTQEYTSTSSWMTEIDFDDTKKSNVLELSNVNNDIKCHNSVSNSIMKVDFVKYTKSDQQICLNKDNTRSNEDYTSESEIIEEINFTDEKKGMDGLERQTFVCNSKLLEQSNINNNTEDHTFLFNSQDGLFNTNKSNSQSTPIKNNDNHGNVLSKFVNVVGLDNSNNRNLLDLCKINDTEMSNSAPNSENKVDIIKNYKKTSSVTKGHKQIVRHDCLGRLKNGTSISANYSRMTRKISSFSKQKKVVPTTLVKKPVKSSLRVDNTVKVKNQIKNSTTVSKHMKNFGLYRDDIKISTSVPDSEIKVGIINKTTSNVRTGGIKGCKQIERHDCFGKLKNGIEISTVISRTARKVNSSGKQRRVLKTALDKNTVKPSLQENNTDKGKNHIEHYMMDSKPIKKYDMCMIGETDISTSVRSSEIQVGIVDKKTPNEKTIGIKGHKQILCHDRLDSMKNITQTATTGSKTPRKMNSLGKQRKLLPVSSVKYSDVRDNYKDKVRNDIQYSNTVCKPTKTFSEQLQKKKDSQTSVINKRTQNYSLKSGMAKIVDLANKQKAHITYTEGTTSLSTSVMGVGLNNKSKLQILPTKDIITQYSTSVEADLNDDNNCKLKQLSSVNNNSMEYTGHTNSTTAEELVAFKAKRHILHNKQSKKLVKDTKNNLFFLEIIEGGNK